MKRIFTICGVLMAFMSVNQALSQSYTFTNAGATGTTGPNQTQINAAYASTQLSGQVTSVNGIQHWTVASSGIYKIEVFGAQGYGPFGGRGAHMTGEFQIVAGTQLKILVGQKGGCCVTSGTNQYGGGGGTFVVDNTNTPWIIAGGGGGSWATGYTTTTDASISTSGNTAANGPTNGAGGTAGNGGATVANGGGGGGFLTDATNPGNPGGYSFINGGNGGTAVATSGGWGGFGGGGGANSWDNRRGGGGGGYSGGGGAGSTTSGFPEGGGGGSFNSGNNQVNLAGVQIGHGMVIITKISGGAPDDAGIGGFPSLQGQFCAGTMAITAKVANYGSNVMDSVKVHWSVNGVIQSTSWLILNGLDTAGSGNNDTIITLGNYTFNTGQTYNIKAWTSLPNNILDTVPANDTTTAIVSPSLSGTYFITPTALPGTYVSFNAAINALVTYGICGPVTFIVDHATYNERVIVPQIPNVSATNRVRFTSLLGNTNAVTLNFASTGAADNSTLILNGADYFTFDHLTIKNSGTGTYANVIDVRAGANYNIIDSCVIKGDPNTAVLSYLNSCILSYVDVDSMNTISNNTIDGGGYGIYWRGVSTTVFDVGTKIMNNIIKNYYYMGIYTYYNYDMEIAYNTATPDPVNPYTTTYGYYNYYWDGSIRFHHNSYVGSKYGYGAFFAQSDALAANPGYVHNNSLSVGDVTNTNISYGLYFLTCTNIVGIANSVYVTSNATTSRALYVTGGNVSIYSNNFVIDGPGYAMYMASGVTNSDYNNGYASTGNVGYTTSAHATLLDLQNATNMDLNSVSTDPAFPAFNNLTTCNDLLDMAGMSDTIVVDDINGLMRSPIPDIGAFEFDGVANFSLGIDSSICSSDFIMLGNPYSTSTWVWNNGLTTPSINVNIPGTYIAQISNSCGIGLDTVVVTHKPDPTAIFSSYTSYLTGGFNNNSIAADTYFWDFGDGSTSTLEDPLHIYSNGGWYTVTLTVTGECGTHTKVDSIYLFVNGIDESATLHFDVYPNPAADNISISTNLMLSNASVEILDAIGRLVLQTNVSGQVTSINVQDLKSGTYFIRVTDQNRSTVRQLILE